MLNLSRRMDVTHALATMIDSFGEGKWLHRPSHIQRLQPIETPVSPYQFQCFEWPRCIHNSTSSSLVIRLHDYLVIRKNCMFDLHGESSSDSVFQLVGQSANSASIYTRTDERGSGRQVAPGVERNRSISLLEIRRSSRERMINNKIGAVRPGATSKERFRWPKGME